MDGIVSMHPENSFVTVVPTDVSGVRNILRDLPQYSGEHCAGCKVIFTCRNRENKLPFMIWEVINKNHSCPRFDVPLDTCWVVHLMEEEPGRPVTPPLYLIDANIIINAFMGEGNLREACLWMITSGTVRIATIDRVLNEAYNIGDNTIPESIEILPVGQMDPRLVELRPPRGCKEPSNVDLSLMQAVLDHREVKGIVTFDGDFRMIAAAGFLSNWTNRKVEVLNAIELRERILRSKGH
jgi:hypothetical protein